MWVNCSVLFRMTDKLAVGSGLPTPTSDPSVFISMSGPCVTRGKRAGLTAWGWKCPGEQLWGEPMATRLIVVYTMLKKVPAVRTLIYVASPRTARALGWHTQLWECWGHLQGELTEDRPSLTVGSTTSWFGEKTQWGLQLPVLRFCRMLWTCRWTTFPLSPVW